MIKTDNIIEYLESAKIEIMRFNHAFENNGKIYYKLLPGDETNLHIKPVLNKFSGFDSSGRKAECNVNDYLKNSLQFTINNGQFCYNLPANTFFIDATIQALKTGRAPNFKKYQESIIESEFTFLGTIEQPDIKQIKGLQKFADSKHLNQALNCVLLHQKKILATNSHYLIVEDITSEFNNLLLPEQAIKFLDVKTACQVYTGTQKIKLVCGTKELIFDRIIDKWPIEPAKDILVNNYPLFVEVYRTDLLEAINKAKKTANQGSYLVELTTKLNAIHIKSQDLDFSLCSTIRVPINSANFTGSIHVNSIYLINILNHIKTDTIKIYCDELKNHTIHHRALFINNIVLMPMACESEAGFFEVKPIEPVNKYQEKVKTALICEQAKKEPSKEVIKAKKEPVKPIKAVKPPKAPQPQKQTIKHEKKPINRQKIDLELLTFAQIKQLNEIEAEQLTRIVLNKMIHSKQLTKKEVYFSQLPQFASNY